MVVYFSLPLAFCLHMVVYCTSSLLCAAAACAQNTYRSSRLGCYVGRATTSLLVLLYKPAAALLSTGTLPTGTASHCTTAACNRVHAAQHAKAAENTKNRCSV